VRSQDKKYVLFGFSTAGFEDIMKHGGKEVLETKYKGISQHHSLILHSFFIRIQYS
jgi:hypothetical protein